MQENMALTKIRPPVIFIVDDEPDNVSRLSEYFRDMNVKILTAQHGEQVLEQMETVLPDLVLLDVLLPPGIDGFETCRRLKSNERTRDIPIIFMTALTESENPIKGFEAGGVDYIAKPFECRAVLARVNAHLTIWRQQQQIQDINASKNKFLSIITHDFRSALGSLSTATQLAEEHLNTRNWEKLHDVLVFQQKSVDHLDQLLENLLTWAKVLRGRIEYAPRLIDMYQIAAWNVKLLAGKAEQKQIALHNAVPRDTFAYGDMNMIDTVVRNLMSNAVKFTNPGGRVTISTMIADQRIDVAVTDTGVGITPDNIEKIFRLDAKHKRPGTAHETGTGLGLLICKEFIEKNHGEIGVENTPGTGTTFHFTLLTTPSREQGI